MSITRLDCQFYRGERAANDASSFVALNPCAKPARLVFAGSTAIRESLGSQVAYRLALDYFVHGVDHHYAETRANASRAMTPGLASSTSDESDDPNVLVLEEAFRAANASVYSFGHKLAAGGRLAASLLGLVIEDGRVATGRVGLGSVYLFRGDQLFPFFEAPETEVAKVGDAGEYPDDLTSRKRSFIGMQSVVDVELASVSLEPEDILCVFSRPLTSLNETLLFEFLEALQGEGFPGRQQPGLAARMCAEVFTEPDTLSFSMIAAVGPDTIYCSERVAA